MNIDWENCKLILKDISKVEVIQDIVKETNLKHIAIIMDGNRRWAKERFLPSAMGHKEGVNALKRTLTACKEFGIKYLTVYAFSTENWNRSKDEVEFLMKLLFQTIKDEILDINKNEIKVKFIGDLSKLSENLRNLLYETENDTKDNKGVNLQIAFNYGSKNEIINAVKRIIKDNVKIEDINEELFANYLYTSNIPDPDLLIRTGGEMRISNFLTYQIAYSEILILDKYWPQFDENELGDAVIEFQRRNRRFGA